MLYCGYNLSASILIFAPQHIKTVLMKKLLLLIAVLFLAMQGTSAQARPEKARARYFNLSYGTQTLKSPEVMDVGLKSDYAAALSIGRTFYLHKTPLWGMVKFGLDCTWFDANFASYKVEEEDYSGYSSYDPDEDDSSYDDEDSSIGSYQLELGVHVGPSITVTPVKNLKVNAYFRYAPSVSAFLNDDDAHWGYGSFFVSGAAVSYKVISLGAEGRWGSSKYSSLSEEIEDEWGEGDDSSKKVKFNTSGMRVYVSLRF